jgi:hypothetical protein
VCWSVSVYAYPYCQVVAHRHLAAKRVAPPLDHKLLEIVRVRLHKDRHVKSRQLDRVRHTLLIAKVGQADQHAVDLARMPPEQLGTQF